MMTQAVLNLIFRDCSIMKQFDEKKKEKKSKNSDSNNIERRNRNK